MPYQATIFRVIIASPNDVEQERRIAREVIYDWNSLHSANTKIVFEPVGWETNSSPEMGDRPQSIINKQILKNADLLVGIFWTRLGTPTGKAESGTVEEIEEHIENGKPVMLYFSNQPVILDSIDREQYEKLSAFKNECKTKGLLHEYESLSQFREDFYRHLVRTVNNNKYFTPENANSKMVIEEELPVSTVHEITLSKEAQELLIEASQSPDGKIMRLRTNQGLIIQTNKKGFVGERNARLEAIWEDALNQLIENSLIEDKGYKGEVFAVTRLGYEYADRLKKDADILQDKSSAGTSASIQQDDLEFEKASGTYISKEDSIRYCHKCLHSSSQRIPLKEQKNGWRCNVCDKFYPNPNYDRPTHTRNKRDPMMM